MAILWDYHWDFGNGQTASGQSAEVTYNQQNTYIIELTVTDDDGATSSTTNEIIVNSINQIPVASFTATPSAGVAPLTVSFGRLRVLRP